MQDTPSTLDTDLTQNEDKPKATRRRRSSSQRSKDVNYTDQVAKIDSCIIHPFITSSLISTDHLIARCNHDIQPGVVDSIREKIVFIAEKTTARKEARKYHIISNLSSFIKLVKTADHNTDINSEIMVRVYNNMTEIDIINIVSEEILGCVHNTAISALTLSIYIKLREICRNKRIPAIMDIMDNLSGDEIKWIFGYDKRSYMRSHMIERLTPESIDFINTALNIKLQDNLSESTNNGCDHDSVIDSEEIPPDK